MCISATMASRCRNGGLMAKIKEAIEDFKPDSRLVGMGT
jgi:hypothetical protein